MWPMQFSIIEKHKKTKAHWIQTCLGKTQEIANYNIVRPYKGEGYCIKTHEIMISMPVPHLGVRNIL